MSDDAFREALWQSLKNVGMLDSARADSSSRLLATIVEVAVHSSWLTHEFRANALVRYRLVAPDGRTLLEDSVASEGIAGFRDAPLGTTRARVVRERAMRNNIARFIERLRHTPPHAP